LNIPVEICLITASVVQASEPERKVRQFHYTTWPDQSVPETCTALIKFHDAIFSPAEESPELDGPVIIHCRYEEHYIHSIAVSVKKAQEYYNLVLNILCVT